MVEHLLDYHQSNNEQYWLRHLNIFTNESSKSEKSIFIKRSSLIILTLSHKRPSGPTSLSALLPLSHIILCYIPLSLFLKDKRLWCEGGKYSHVRFLTPSVAAAVASVALSQFKRILHKNCSFFLAIKSETFFSWFFVLHSVCCCFGAVHINANIQ